MRAADQVLTSEPSERFVVGPLARWGYGRYLRTGTTPTISYRAMRKLFGARETAAFDALVARAAQEHPLLELTAAEPGVAAGAIDATADVLRANGFAVLPALLPAGECDELEATARAATCRLVGSRTPHEPARFDESAPQAIRYDVEEVDALRSPAAQRLVADPSLLAVAQAYLGAAPVQDLVAMWWSTAADEGEGAASTAAQQFHFDLDRLRFLKVFVLLTDVDEHTGPHVYVRGSHRGLSQALRQDGRHSDAEVLAARASDVREIAGPRGTIFLADTRGLHKGKHLEHGHRLIFQTECATSLFGTTYTEPVVEAPTPELAEAVRRFPTTFRRFRLQPAP